MVAIVVLGIQDTSILKSTLSSYKNRGLLKLFKERLIFSNKTTACRRKIAKDFGFQLNINQEGEGSVNTWYELFKKIQSKYIFLLEEGALVSTSAAEVKDQLKTCLYLLNHNKVNLVRFMHTEQQKDTSDIVEKYKAYYPDQENKTDLVKFLKRKLRSSESQHVIGASVCVHDHPETVHPHEIMRYNNNCFITSSRYLSWTGKSIIVNKDWMLNVILQRISKNLFNNKNINKALSGSWWDHQNFPIAICRDAS